MLPIYQSGADATVTVDYPKDGAGLVVATSVTYQVLDEVGNIVIDTTAATNVPPNAIVAVPGSYNTLEDGFTRAMRVVVVSFTKANGATLTSTARYVIEAQQMLILMQNSYQTYDQALLTRMDLPALAGWDDAEDDRERIAAMVSAYDGLARMTYRYRLSQQALEWDSLRGDLWWYVSDMALRTLDDWNNWPNDFRNALMRAQVYEADTLLAGDAVGDKRAQGIVSETTGEAKMFFSTKPPLRHPVGAAALRCIATYLYSSRRIGRA